MARMWNKLEEAWCKLMHPDPMWPVKGMYRCPACLREYPVCWEQGINKQAVLPVPAQATEKMHPAYNGLQLIKPAA